MKKQTINRTLLEADEGMVITNGKVYGAKIFLAVGASDAEYHEITKEEYEAIMKAQEEANEERSYNG